MAIDFLNINLFSNEKRKKQIEDELLSFPNQIECVPYHSLRGKWIKKGIKWHLVAEIYEGWYIKEHSHLRNLEKPQKIAAFSCGKTFHNMVQQGKTNLKRKSILEYEGVCMECARTYIRLTGLRKHAKMNMARKVGIFKRRVRIESEDKR